MKQITDYDFSNDMPFCVNCTAQTISVDFIDGNKITLNWDTVKLLAKQLKEDKKDDT